jgi:PST family polysaccharide transporter
VSSAEKGWVGRAAPPRPPVAARERDSRVGTGGLGGAAPSPQPSERQTAQAGRSFIWTSLESISVSGVLFIVVILMARLLTPPQFGIVAIGLAVVTPMTAIVESLFYEAMIHLREVTDQHADMAFTVALGLGAAGSALCWGIGALLARLYGLPELTMLTGAMGITLLFSGLGAVPVAMLRRDLRYRSLAIRSIFGRGLGAAIGLGSAAFGAGEWALVIQQIATAALGFVVILGSTGRFPRLGVHKAELRQLLVFGVPSVMTTLTFHLDVRIYSLVVGYLYGTVTLGYLNLAYRLVDGIRDMLHGSTYHLALPLLSRRRDDRAGLVRGYLRALRMVSGVTLPLFAAGGIFAAELLAVTVGPKWLPSTPIVQITAVGACIYFLIDAAPIVFGTLQRPQLSMAINLIGMGCGLALLAALPRGGPALPALIWVGRGALIAVLTTAALLWLGTPARALARATLPTVICTGLMTAAVVALRDGALAGLPPAGVLAIGAPAAACLGVLLARVLMRDTVHDIMAFLMGAVLRRGRAGLVE